MEELETKYYIITFADGHRAYMYTKLHLWEILKLHYNDEKISLIQRVMEREFYNEVKTCADTIKGPDCNT